MVTCRRFFAEVDGDVWHGVTPTDLGMLCVCPCLQALRVVAGNAALARTDGAVGEAEDVTTSLMVRCVMHGWPVCRHLSTHLVIYSTACGWQVGRVADVALQAWSVEADDKA